MEFLTRKQLPLTFRVLGYSAVIIMIMMPIIVHICS